VTPPPEDASAASLAPASIRVLVVDDDPLAREGVIAILSTADDIVVVGQCSDGSQVNGGIASSLPHVVLMDVRMPVVDGVTAVELAQGHPLEPRFLMMTAFDDDGRVLDAIVAGASGFLMKDEHPTGIIDAVRDVANGEYAYSARSAGHLSRWVRNSGNSHARRDAAAKMASITEREREIALALVSGPSDAELAQRFFVAESTIKSALASIKSKWGVKNRTQIAVIVARSGLD
jgi:DNA-binding NarL/FixJ family response regulator